MRMTTVPFLLTSGRNHVNFVMKEINELTDDIYESLMDEEYNTAQGNIDSLIEKLKEISSSIKV